MSKIEAIINLVQAIEDIENNWAEGDLASAVRNAVMVKDEICQRYQITRKWGIEAA